MSWGRRSTASRYSPKLSHDHSIPSSSTAPGMSSTPSMREMSRSWASGRTGAKPTPQLPITAVVTPCQLLGVDVGVPGGLPVVVGVDVDEAGRHEQTGGVDLLAPPAGHVPDGGDRGPVDGDIGRHRLAAEAVGQQAAPDHQLVCRACHAPCPSDVPGLPGAILARPNCTHGRGAAVPRPAPPRSAAGVERQSSDSVPSAARTPLRPTPSSAQSRARASGSLTLAQARLPSAVRQARMPRSAAPSRSKVTV